MLGIIQILERLWKWAKEQLITEELNNIHRQTIWHLAAANSKLEALDKLWECANGELTPQESSSKFVLT